MNEKSENPVRISEAKRVEANDFIDSLSSKPAAWVVTNDWETEKGETQVLAVYKDAKTIPYLQVDNLTDPKYGKYKNVHFHPFARTKSWPLTGEDEEIFAKLMEKLGNPKI